MLLKLRSDDFLMHENIVMDHKPKLWLKLLSRNKSSKLNWPQQWEEKIFRVLYNLNLYDFVKLRPIQNSKSFGLKWLMSWYKRWQESHWRRKESFRWDRIISIDPLLWIDRIDLDPTLEGRNPTRLMFVSVCHRILLETNSI